MQKNYIILLAAIIISISISISLGIEAGRIGGNSNPDHLDSNNISSHNSSDKVNFPTGSMSTADAGENLLCPQINNSEIEKKINIMIEPNGRNIHENAVELAKIAPGSYNIAQICSIYDFVAKNWAYVPDPRCTEYYQNASESLKHGGDHIPRGGAGDCDDFAILMASMIESISGTSRITLATNPNVPGHAFTEVYLGNDWKKIKIIKNYLKKRYHLEKIATRTDMTTNDTWLNLDWGENINKHNGTPGGDLYKASSYIPIYIRSNFPKSSVASWPIVSFAYQSANGKMVSGEPITFNATQCEIFDIITSYEWNFGDNKTAKGPLANHTYVNSGNYTISLTVTDYVGNCNSTSVEISIALKPRQGEELHPMPEITLFAADKDNINLGDSSSLNWITLNATDVTLEPGIGRVKQNGTLSISPANSTTYILRASNSEYYLEQSVHILVYNYKPPEVPTPSISYDILSPKEGDIITFNEPKSNDKSGNITYYEWNFDDGSIALGKSVQHAFLTGGTYKITLTEINENGLKGYNTIPISIGFSRKSLPVVPSFSCYPENPIDGQEIVFDASSSQGDILEYQWNFDDGSPIEEGISAKHTYSFESSSSMPYDVILTVTDSAGLQHSVSKIILVAPSQVTQVTIVANTNSEYLGIVRGKLHNKKNGQPVAHAEISYRRWPDGEEIWTGVMTDLNGNYQLELSPGQYQISARASGYGVVPWVVDVYSGQITERDLRAVKGV